MRLKPTLLLTRRRRDRNYWLRLLLLFLLVLTVTLAAFPVVMGALFAQGLLYSPCNNDGRTPADYGLVGESVTLSARAGGSFKGYFMPGTNRVTIIIPPPLNNGRSIRLLEAAMLVQHGYAVFTFEARPCAGM